MSSLEGVCIEEKLSVLNEAKTKKKKVTVLALGQYNVCEVKRIWWDDFDDMIELFIPETKRKWKVGTNSITQVRIL